MSIHSSPCSCPWFRKHIELNAIRWFVRSFMTSKSPASQSQFAIRNWFVHFFFSFHFFTFFTSSPCHFVTLVTLSPCHFGHFGHFGHLVHFFRLFFSNLKSEQSDSDASHSDADHAYITLFPSKGIESMDRTRRSCSGLTRGRTCTCPRT